MREECFGSLQNFRSMGKAIDTQILLQSGSEVQTWNSSTLYLNTVFYSNMPMRENCAKRSFKCGESNRQVFFNVSVGTLAS